MFIICGGLSITTPLNAHQQSSEPGTKTATAVRINTESPVIDGVLNDATWQQAPSFTSFQQRGPHEGAAATEKTSFQVVYDDQALYFAIVCYDQEPDKIAIRLGRRDSRLKSDRVSIYLDPYHDHHTGNQFSVYASGVKADGVYADDRDRGDTTWDAIWEVKTRLYDNGWQAEFRIPYDALRFTNKPAHTWGLNVVRDISRKNESCFWMLIRRQQAGWVSGFGHLEGLRNIKPPRHLAIMPYAMGGLIRDSQSTMLTGRGGGDILYGVTSGITMSATINPDFGQVEADPAELNLSAFESYFEERRPFFVEGSNIFQTGHHPQLFYSRRIGKPPQHFEIPAGQRERHRPEATTILAAAKITGKTRHRTSFGLLNAVTRPEYAELEGDGGGRYLIEPLSNYFVGRLRREILSGNSHLGFISTAVTRQDSVAAFVQGIDWNVKFPSQGRRENQYQFDGLVSSNQKEGRKEAQQEGQNGFLGRMAFSKRQGAYQWRVTTETTSSSYDINDMGFNDVRPTGNHYLGFDTNFEQNRPMGPFLRSSTGINGWIDWNYNGQQVSAGSDLILDVEFKNFWHLGFVFARDYQGLDEDWGVQLLQPPAWAIDLWLDTDNRKVVTLGLNPRFWRRDDGSSYERMLQLKIEIKLTDNTVFRLGPGYNHRFSFSQWVDEVHADGVPLYIFAELDSKTIDFTTRVNTSLSPDLSLEFFIQPFVAIGDYDRFKTLVAPLTYRFTQYSSGPDLLKQNRDFYYRSLRSNLVLRWEYQPGSTIFIVWSQSREAENSRLVTDDLRRSPIDRLIQAFSDPGENFFLVKANYWFGI